MADKGGNERRIRWHHGTRALGIAGFVFGGWLLADGRTATEIGLWLASCLCLLGYGERLRLDQYFIQRRRDQEPDDDHDRV